MRSHRHLILLITLVMLVVAESFTRHVVVGPTASDIIVTVAACSVFLLVFEGRRERVVALVTAIAAVFFTWSRRLHLEPPFGVINTGLHHALLMVFIGYAVVVILADIFKRRAVTADDVLGTICGYLLAGAFFANAYSLCELLVPGSFSVAQESESLKAAHSHTALFNYFSMVTLTTMGYGDVTPVRPPATAIATLEAVFGQFYIAIVVAQLVGMRMASGERQDKPPAQ
ncbi:MAG: potassium channel family protein [Burkholderiales bacterium]